MQYLVSLPSNSVNSFHKLTGKPGKDWFCTSDPEGRKVGSGGGTAWLLKEAWENSASGEDFSSWLSGDKRILIHGGGQSRRLPSYAPSGKLLIPVPVYRWARGQRLDQTLLDLQLPLLQSIMNKTPAGNNTLLASGDALNISPSPLPDLPESDVISFGLSVDASLASRHGVFICSRDNPEALDRMLQKPSVSVLKNLAVDYFFYIDLGILLLSDKAVSVLMEKSGWGTESFPLNYDFYGTFAPALGKNPENIDPDINALSVSIVNLTDGEFYHFGTGRELISSSLSLQNKVNDQSEIWTRGVKPHPAMFVQNAELEIKLEESQGNLWIENSFIGAAWKVEGNQIVTGVPGNNWEISLPSGVCLDMVPVKGGSKYALRLYGFDDSFRGSLGNPETTYLGMGFSKWMEERGLDYKSSMLDSEGDIQDAKLFPFVNPDEVPVLVEWIIQGIGDKGKTLWQKSERLSANEIAAKANLAKLEEQRRTFRCGNWKALRKNYKKSVFFQIDLDHAAEECAECGISAISILPEKGKDSLSIIHENMFLSRLSCYEKNTGNAKRYKDIAFRTLQQSILNPVKIKKVVPVKNIYEDQIVWSRSPVRIDLAGGWSDTPPYSILEGGKVVNVAVELNGQPPLQAFIRPRKDSRIVLRSIDLGQREIVTTFAELSSFTKVGSAFAIPKAALCLSGFHPDFSGIKHKDLKSMLEDFGGGLEISFLAAIPKGSGMGTSSILAATILGGLSDFYSLGWDSFDLGNRTLGLEQLLTTGGGWQDQYGGIVSGIKLLETERGWEQIPRIRWLPDNLFTKLEYLSSMLLYYTGITRVARNLLTEIVEGMFLNENERLSILQEIKQHALDMRDTIQQGDFTEFGKKILHTWNQKKRIDSDTTNNMVESIIAKIDDLALGYKLPGAGGGGVSLYSGKGSGSGPPYSKAARRRSS